MFHLLGSNSFHKAPSCTCSEQPAQRGCTASRTEAHSAADGQGCETSLQTQQLEMLHLATAEAEISSEFLGFLKTRTMALCSQAFWPPLLRQLAGIPRRFS